MTPCAVIPVYNHEHAIGHVVGAVRAAQLPCILVDDGSSSACAQVLDALAAGDPEVRLVRLARNSGKGAAVSAGLRAARRAGFTHGLQIDADGQHALGDIPKFIVAAARRPDALICGRPVFDESMPASRRYGRYLTHIFVWAWTMSLAIPDSMCGFRVYPLAPIVALLDSVRLGERMDFDVEILVWAFWRRIPMEWIDTKVSYPLDGVSHFDVVRDNARMVRLHAHLLLRFIPRIPVLLWRKLS